MSAAQPRHPRVHQVLATLGYGDAIGHEVLGIQRVLRDAGYDSEIFVETADPRLEPLTLDYEGERGYTVAIVPWSDQSAEINMLQADRVLHATQLEELTHAF
jgi:hypothetical protein